MSTDKSAQLIETLTESHTETDKTQSTASNETTSSVTIKPVGLEEGDNKKGNKTFSDNNSVIDSYRFGCLICFFEIMKTKKRAHDEDDNENFTIN